MEDLMKLKPLGNRVVIEPIEQEEMTAGGIVLPETAKEKPQKGTVVAAGPGERDDDGKHIELDVKVGDQVLFAKYAGTEIKIEGKKLLILRETDLLAIIE
jgi:chaperonin GroES